MRSGYYYWADEDTPHYPRPHLLGSRIWTSDDFDDSPRLGEWDGEQQWRDGSPPPIVPAARTIGQPSCIEAGEQPGLPTLPFTPNTPGLLLPRACYVKADLDNDTSVFDCRFQWYAAEIVRRAYVDTVDAKAFALDYFTNIADGDVIPESVDNLFPQAIVIKRQTEAYLFITGTQRAVQWIGQALIAPDGAINLGQYSAGRIWEFAARYHLERMMAFVGVGITRFVICGHSYGGACAQLVAAKLKLGDPDVRVDLITWGSPKPGDQRVQNLIAGGRAVHFVNEGDPVPYVPPNLAPGILNDVLDPALRTLWASFRRPHVLTLVPETGPARRITRDEFNGDILTATLRVLLATARFNPFYQHLMPTYVQRLRRLCPHLLSPTPDGFEWPQFSLCDPALKWPMTLYVEIRFGEVGLLTLELPRVFLAPTYATWQAAAGALMLLDLNAGDADGKIRIDGVVASYDCGNDHLVLNVTIAAPFAHESTYSTAWTTQNPLLWDVELIAGGAMGPTASLNSPAGPVTRTFTARVVGPDLGP